MVTHTTPTGSTDRWCDAYANVRVIVFGATGFIGSRVSRYLSAAQAELHLVLRDRPRGEQLVHQQGVIGTVWNADLSDPQQVRDILFKLQPSIVFNLAGYGVDRTERDEGMAQQINVRLVEAISQALLDIPDRGWQGMDLVHVGSALEYGEIGGDLVETCEPNPTTIYGRTKLQGTSVVNQYGQRFGLKGITARLFTVYGPGEHPGRLLPSLIEAAKTAAPIPLTAGNQKRDFVYVGDVAEGLLRLGAASVHQQGEIVNLATGRLTTVRQFTEAASDILEIPRERLKFGALPTRSEEMQHDPVNIQRLIQRIGWQPAISIVDGVQRAINSSDPR